MPPKEMVTGCSHHKVANKPQRGFSLLMPKENKLTISGLTEMYLVLVL